MSVIAIIAIVWAVVVLATYTWLALDTIYYNCNLQERWKAVKEAFTEE